MLGSPAPRHRCQHSGRGALGMEAELLRGEVLSTPDPALDPRGLHFISVELHSGSQSGDENIREISTSETA